MTPTKWAMLAAIFGLHGVVIGAFGAHGFETILEANERVATFQTGVEYHMYHAVALFALATWMPYAHPSARRWLQWAAWSLSIGILVFPGTLYVLSLTNIRWLGAITPLGGLAFLIGWAFIAWACFRFEPEPTQAN